MDPSIPSYTRGNKTYYDTAGLSFSESMKVSFAAGWENAEIFDSTQMNCPKWVEQQVLARRRREARQSSNEQDDFRPFESRQQKDLFKPRRMSGVQIDAHAQPLESIPEWRCEYCQMTNAGGCEVCTYCGAPK